MEQLKKTPVVDKIESPLSYVWSQTQGTVEIEVDVPNDFDQSARQWSVQFESEHLRCALNDTVVFDATLIGPINPKESSYVIVTDRNHQLSITLQKANVGFFWNDVFKEGRTIPGNVDLRNLPETVHVPEDDEVKQPYNSQQLEECDQYPNENDTLVYRFDGDTHKITHQGLLTHQILFTKSQPASLCIRHDVSRSKKNLRSQEEKIKMISFRSMV